MEATLNRRKSSNRKGILQRWGIPFFGVFFHNRDKILQKVYKKRKITAEKTVKVAIPI